MDPKTIVLVMVTPKMVPLVLGNPPCHLAVYLKHPISWSHSSRCRAWGPGGQPGIITQMQAAMETLMPPIMSFFNLRTQLYIPMGHVLSVNEHGRAYPEFVYKQGTLLGDGRKKKCQRAAFGCRLTVAEFLAVQRTGNRLN